ncbi:hypothetical protein R5R35_002418 [Gryllus longicercus]
MDKVKNEKIKRKAEVSFNIIDTMEVKRRKWYGHMQRMNEERWPKILWKLRPATQRRHRLSWGEGVDEAMEKLDSGMKTTPIERCGGWHARDTLGCNITRYTTTSRKITGEALKFPKMF